MASFITGFRADLDKGYLTLIHDPHVIRLRLVLNAFNIIEGTLPMAITIKDNQKFTARVSGAVSARGNPVPIDGVASFAVSDVALVSLANVTDLSADVLATGPLGNAQLVISVGADRGDGVRTIGGVVDITIIASEAASLVIETSVPVDQ